MPPPRHLPLIALLLPCSLLLGEAAQAQQQPRDERARQIFAREPDTRKPQTVVAGSFSAGTGDALLGENAPVAEDLYHTGVQANLSHRRESPSRVFSLNAGTSARFYPQTRDFLTLSRSASVDLDSRIGRTGRFRAGQAVAFTPFRQFGTITGNNAPVEGEFSSAHADGASSIGQASYELATTVDVGRNFGQRAGVNLSYVMRTNMHPGSTEQLMTQNAGVNFRYSVTPQAALVVGTTSRMGRSGIETSARPTRAQDIDIGLDYNRALTFARNTKVSFTSGTALVSRDLELAGGDRVQQRSFLAIGAVVLNRPLGRNWEGRVGYDKNLRFIDGLPEPFYADGANARLTGRYGRRLTLRAQADYSSGRSIDSSTTGIDQYFRGLQTQARIGYALSRNWLLFGEHFYAENFLSAGALASLPPGVIPRRFGRGVRIGISLWANKVH